MALLLFQKIASLFLCLGAGFLLVKLKMVKSADSRILTILCIYLILPCVIIQAFQLDLTAEVRQGFVFALVLSLAVNIVLLLVARALGRLLKLKAIEQAALVFSNATNLNFPLIIAIMGNEWIVYASAFVCVQLLMVWTIGVSMIRGQNAANWKKILFNCNLVSVMIGILLMVTGIRLPKIVADAMSLTSPMLGPLSMVMIGMMLAGIDLKAAFSDKRVYLVTFLKLIVVPGIVLLLLKLCGVADIVGKGVSLTYLVFLAVIAPTGVIVPQLSQLYDRDAEHAGAINVVTTLLCIATMPLMTEVYRLLIGSP